MIVVSRPHLGAEEETPSEFTIIYTANFGEWDVGGTGGRVGFDNDEATMEAAIDVAYGTTSSVDISVDGDTYTIVVTFPDSVDFAPTPIAMSRGEVSPLGMATTASPSWGWNDIGGDPGPDDDPPGWGWDWGFNLDGANVGWVYLDDTITPGNGLEGILINNEWWWATDTNETLQATCQDHGRPDALVDGEPPYRRIYTETWGEAPTVPELTGEFYIVTAVMDWTVA